MSLRTRVRVSACSFHVFSRSIVCTWRVCFVSRTYVMVTRVAFLCAVVLQLSIWCPPRIMVKYAPIWVCSAADIRATTSATTNFSSILELDSIMFDNGTTYPPVFSFFCFWVLPCSAYLPSRREILYVTSLGDLSTFST